MRCRVCRARKVKCDGRPNGCRNCERLQLECVADDGTTTGHRPSPVSLRKIRTYRSCTTCRLSKTKCDGDRPRCSRCATKNIECVYDGGPAPRWARNLDEEAQAKGADEDRSDSLERTSASLDEQPESASMTPQDDEVAGTMLPSKPEPVPEQPQPQLSQSSPVDPFLSGALSWLLAAELPPARNLRRLVDQYFINVHPVRCFAFVHKPSFMRQMDKGFTTDDENMLLHVICAHGAKFYALSLNQFDQTPSTAFLRAVGNQWAQKAENLLLNGFGQISLQRLMTAVLLHDFHFRMGEFNQALMLSGFTVRMAHALKINTEYSPDLMCTDSPEAGPSIVARESRRRVMWACYVLDAWSSNGNDQLTLLREHDIKIQLPCNERNFGLRIASVTETLGVGHVLQFLSPAIVPRRPAANMGIMAYYIRIVSLWKKIVRYVNRPETSQPPWVPESDFAALDSDLRLWRRELPDFVEYSADTIYARLDSNQLGALVIIHCTYHHNYLELYKISMPDLFKLRKPFIFPSEYMEFLLSMQAECYHHAHKIASILAEASQHGSRLLSDGLLPFFAYDSSRVILYYIARILDPNSSGAQKKIEDSIAAVESNNDLLREIAPLLPIAESLSTAIERWLVKIRRSLGRTEPPSRTETSDESLPEVDISIPPISPNQGLVASGLANPALMRPDQMGSDGRDLRSGSGVVNSTNWSTTNPNANSTWDHTNAAHQLIGMSLEGPVQSGLQHERPVSSHPQPRPALMQPMCDAIDLQDLQNNMSWDIYGIMEIGETLSSIETDGAAWNGSL
ncbi:fungal-specific transcription factor domain-containing protein [Stachybotrys elegans]|uniref:Fungal-specific transcription factor domain-containing protein n=1 Tax=Stachybotrys elegans TaxID=80388 RepID=A0A8K0WKV8_9HYPO|nr:fungal-specific transcription factor domain-containing protein [Stachybotrys elegans]